MGARIKSGYFSKCAFWKSIFHSIIPFEFNIWDCADKPNCTICKQYQKWCITAAKEQWEKKFIDFDFVIDALKK